MASYRAERRCLRAADLALDQTASVALPYWHEGEKGAAAFRAAWQCLEVLRDQAGYDVYDPQLDRILDLRSPRDFDEAVRRYLATKHAGEQAIRKEATPQPWWKIW